MIYALCDPIPNKYLQPDGSITTLDGTRVAPADPTRAQQYLQSDPIVNKCVNPDGTIGTLPGVAAPK